jgi:hypothetical protein
MKLRVRGGVGRADRRLPRRERERGREWGCERKTRTKNTMRQWWGCLQERTTFPEAIEKTSIEDEPSVGLINRRYQDEALNETNAVVPSNSVDDARIESNCSPELPPELETSRTSVSNSGSIRSRLGMEFRISKRTRWEDSSYIYIYIARVWRYFIFSNYPIFKIISNFKKRLKSFLISEKYPKGSKNSRKIPGNDLAPIKLKKHIWNFWKCF